jgi:hypothetical protein
MPTSAVVCSSYRFGCGSVSWLGDGTKVYLRYAFTFLFSLCVIGSKCVLLTIWNFTFYTDDAELWPTLAYR